MLGVLLVLVFAGLVMWGLSKLPARLRNRGQKRLIRAQSGAKARHR